MKTMILMLCVSVCTASWAMRCGNKLVTDRDYQSRVLALCGEPDFSNSFYRYRHRYYGGTEEIRVDEWVYNRGPTEFNILLRFENGYLVDEKVLDRGY